MNNALRTLRRSPRLAVAATLCVAIGVGATVAMLVLVNASLLRELPYPESDRLVRIWTSVADGNPRSGVSIPDFVDIQRESHAFELLVATARERFIFLGDERAERMRGEAVSDGYFAITGVEPQLGRIFTGDEWLRTGTPALLISDAIWQRWFARDPSVVGRTVRINPDRAGEGDTTYTVIGVMPVGYQGTVEEDIVDFWMPLARYGSDALQQNRGARVLWTMGRMRSDATLASTQSELASLTGALAAAYPETNARASGWVEPVGENWRSGLRGGLVTLQVAALLLLVIACINVANLLFARVTSRRRELAARQALGASRGRVMVQLMSESLVLALAGGLGGVLIAWGIVRAFVLYSAIEIPAWMELGIDPLIALAAVALMVVTGIAFGTLPALRGTRVPLAASLREGGRGTMSSRRDGTVAGTLVVVQVALTVMLLAGAGLLGKSYLTLAGADLGYRTDDIARFAVSVNPSDFEGADALRVFYDELVAAIEAEPGVIRAGLVFPTVQPWSGLRPTVSYRNAGDDEAQSVQVHAHAIEPGFFETMDMTLLRGRMFSPSEAIDGPRVALVSRSFAEALAPGGDALGRVFELGDNQFEVVGIAADVRFDGALSPTGAQWRTERSPEHDVYLSLYQRPQSLVSIAVHTGVDAAGMIEPITRRINALAPGSPVHWVSTIETELSDRYAEARFYMLLLAGFGIAAMTLAAIGLYALLANIVVSRTGEIGVRMALGARRTDVQRKFAARGAVLAVAGVTIGLAFALASGRALGTLLHGVSPYDPAVLATAVAFIAAVVAVSVWLPARRAARVDPLVALRNE